MGVSHALRSPRSTGPPIGPRPRRLLIALGIPAIIVAAVAQYVMPAKGSPIVAWGCTVILPGAIVALMIARPQIGPRVAAVICALMYVEAVLLASLYVIGLAFAILLPIIGVGIVQPYGGPRTKLAAYVGAILVATVSVILVELRVPVNPLGADQPELAITAFGLVAAIGLGLTWNTGERLRHALSVSEREVEARGDAERRLESTAGTLEQLIASSPVATIALDERGGVRVWNRAAERLLGWSEHEVLGRRIPDLVGRDATTGAEIAFAELAGAPGSAPPPAERLAQTIAIDARDGSEKLVEVHVASRPAEGGAAARPSVTIVQMVDATERAALEAQLRQAQKMEAVGHLAGGVAHDINNTLTAVGGFAQLIASEAEQPEVRADAEMIWQAVQRGSDLTQRLLTFARRSILQPQRFDVVAFVASLRPMLQRLLGADVAVEVKADVPQAYVDVDPGQLEQALLNLAVNSRDAMPAGGTLTIATRRRVAAEPDELDRVVISVSDTGSGIPPELHERVFDPFFTTKARGKGSGLGLAMVYGFVTQSGGEVVLHSAPDQGTSVEIALLEAEAPEVAAPEPDRAAVPQSPPSTERTAATAATGPTGTSPEAPPSPRPGETILVVEDEPAVAELARRLLVELGYSVLVAHRGTDAIDLASARADPIDLVLSDVIMPGMSGPETVARLSELHPEAAIVYASGYTADVIAERGVLPPDVELIQKPYTRGELARRIRAALDARR